jgi:cytochrome c oxidase cbb3-type subunit I/II
VVSAETTSERDETASSDEEPPAATLAAAAVKAHLLVASLFLVAGLAVFALAAAKLVWPELLDDSALLAYGRLWPTGLNALVFGWLTVALTGVAYHVVPRATGTSLAYPRVALGNLALMAGATGFGLAGIALGRADGGRLSAMPVEARGALLVSALVVAVVVTASARRGERGALPLSAWYLVAAPWWLVGALAVGSVPGMDGLPGEIQSAFSATALTGLWVAAAALGGGYHLVSRLVSDARFNPDLGRIGFWSLGFTWVWTTGMAFQYGPTRDWFETIPVVFSAGLLVAVLTVIADLAGALRGRWSTLSGNPPLLLFAAGTVLFALVPLQIFVQSLRSTSGVIRFTAAEATLDLVAFVGAFTLWAAALAVHALGVGSGRGRSVAGAFVLWPVLTGVLIAAGSRMIVGIQQGTAWIAAVEGGDRDNFGEGFRRSVEGFVGAEIAHVAGLGLALLGATVFALWALTGLRSRHGDEHPDAAPLVTNRLGVVLRGAVLLFVVGALGAFVIPAQDSRAEPSLLAERSRSFEPGSIADRGRQVYLAEGCMYCHTQQVRAVVADVGLGPVSTAGDYAFDPAGTAGYRRVGPDLAHAGSRELTGSARWVRDHLADPRSARPWSTMPSYRYLSDDDLTAVALYVAGLE